ncbi:ADP-ribosylation factor-binding protein GGA1 [Gryllus bimaculatus]|nr:ADP-ribosylation factor-binding protein GGA1 [Gryllus bimaculatus]
MDDVANLLENLIHKATNSKNLVPNDPAIMEVINLLEREPYYAHVATRLIALKIQSPKELEALQTLSLLDSCMKHCGVGFHAEVGKFRFLNEMIKLVSPKYLGSRTPLTVRQRVLHLMHSWTQEYPRELKIKEAYDMLKKQGVVKDDALYATPQSNIPIIPPSRPKNSIFEDEERSRLLQKLLQSKNPDDLQAANRLIKSMVKEDERRVELNTRRITELESVHNNARLLSEMLDSYRPGQTSEEELELIKELHQSCERLRPNVFRLASETQDNEQMLNEVLSASDELGQVFDKYAAVIIRGEVPQPENKNASLLDLSTPSEETVPAISSTLLGAKSDTKQTTSPSVGGLKSDIEVLGDIFGALSVPETSAPVTNILQPVALQQQNSKQSTILDTPDKPSKQRALEDLDVLSETLLKQNLPTTCKMGSQFSKSTAKVPMNLLGKSQEVSSSSSKFSENTSLPGLEATSASEKSATNLDLDFLIGGSVKSSAKISVGTSSNSELLNGDDSMVDLSEDLDTQHSPESSILNTDNLPEPMTESLSLKTSTEHLDVTKEENKNIQANEEKKVEIKPLTDIFVSLDSIKPGSEPPLPVFEERNGVSVILHFAKDTPRPDVSVIVVTTISKNSLPLQNYIFQAVVPKTCKCRLLPPSGSDLPAHNPFLPPSAITQVMLIANPNKEPVSLKFMVSYTMDDETFTEMGEVEKLPIVT